MAVRIITTRHGRADWHGDEKPADQLNERTLNQEGLKQADLLARRLKNEKIDLIITSPLQRAKDTASIVGRYHNAPTEEYEEFMEGDSGGARGVRPEGMTWEFSRVSGSDESPSSKEPCGEVRARALEGLKRIARENDGKTVLVCSHAGPISAILGWLRDMMPGSEFGIDPLETSLTVFNLEDFDDKKFEVEVFNNTKHLE